ncbi:MAG: oxidoreductase [Alphaproteobacteria bacterium]|nr:MAG: oxidoreductase [Alphaproteobacteria bacterium]
MSEHRRSAEADALAREVIRNGPSLDRRRVFQVAAWGATGAMVGGPALAQAPAAAPAPARRILQKDDSRVLNIGATVRTGRYWDFNTWQTPVEQFYVRNHYPTPTVETHPQLAKEAWRLRIHGNAVERELTITYNDLLRMPARSIFSIMQCHGNGRTLFWEQQDMKDVSGGNWLLGAIGLAEWRYVSMNQLLGMVGLKPTAKAALFWSGVDGSGDIGRPLPISQLRERGDDIGLAFQMNGSDLLPDHGAPVRLIVPGWGGAASTKWITEIKIADHDFWVRLNTKGEVYIGPSYQAPRPGPNDEFRGATAEDIKGEPVTWMPPMSTLTVPLVLEKSANVPANYPLQRGQLPMLTAGAQTMTGYAWGPQHGVRDVDYRIDGGAWQRAQIRMPNLGRYTWVRFDFPWTATPGDHVIETRTTDGAGNTQPAEVPFNLYGMANNAIPRFRVRVA